MAGSDRPEADQALMGDAPASSLSMLRLDTPSGGDAKSQKPKIVEVGEDGSFDMENALDATGAAPEAAAAAAEEEEEESLMDLMMADASSNKAERVEKQAKDEKRMKKSFGDGMKAGLKKGFFDAKPKAKARPKAKAAARSAARRPPPPPPPAADEGPVTLKAGGAGADVESVRASIQKEVAANMEGNTHPMAQALKGGDWITPDLVEAMAKRPALARGMADPRCQAAIKELQKNPKDGAKKFDSDPVLREFLKDFCEVMGGHFEKMGKDAAPSAPPTEEEKAKLGPLAAKVAEDAANGKGPTPAKTPEEKKQVEDVLNNADLRDLLMSPKTQGLMQRCADPREFQRAMMDPEERAIIHKLADAGLVKLER